MGSVSLALLATQYHMCVWSFCMHAKHKASILAEYPLTFGDIYISGDA